MRRFLRVDGPGVCQKQLASALIRGGFGGETHRWLPALDCKEFMSAII
jgi:hypothetical protein